VKINRTLKYVLTALTACAALGVVTLVRVLDAAADQGGRDHTVISPADIYTVTATQQLAANAFAPPLEVTCHSGDAVLSGSCTQEVDSVAPIAIHESRPIASNDGWRCTVSNQWGFTATLRATAVCVGSP
jgi:hypothetical protein